MSTSSTLAAALLGCVLAPSACGAGCYYYIYLVKVKAATTLAPCPSCVALCVCLLSDVTYFTALYYTNMCGRVRRCSRCFTPARVRALAAPRCRKVTSVVVRTYRVRHRSIEIDSGVRAGSQSISKCARETGRTVSQFLNVYGASQSISKYPESGRMPIKSGRVPIYKAARVYL